VDDANAISQTLWETANLTSARWNTDLNPVGLGITGDDTIQPFDIRSADEAARVTVQAIYAMVKKAWHPKVPMPDGAASWMDGVWLPKVRGATYPKGVDQVKDQNIIYDGNRATWAVDPSYMGHVDRFNSLITVPDQEEAMADITFGKVPHPQYQDRPIMKAEGKGQNNLGRRTVKGVSWHRILGTLWGTDGFFRNPEVNALTDYGVGVLAQDGASNDGMILRWNDPLGLQSGWASGTYSQAHAYGDGAAFVDKYGINAINRDRASIEISGFQNTPLSDKSRRSIAAITAYWADQYRIPWDVFPISPQDGFSFVAWHEEFGPDEGTKKCPFEVVKAETPALIELTRMIMMQFQTGDQPLPPLPPPPKELVLPEGLTWQLLGRLYNPLGIKDPDTGKRVTFKKSDKIAMRWVRFGIQAIPKGRPWHESTGFSPLVEIIKRGDGGRVYQHAGLMLPVAKEDL
jgi:hypothetical protein